ncbi:MAG: transposase [Lachnospiraceae bacterium]|nr:transposase [Lachnospiraceae bacterium]
MEETRMQKIQRWELLVKERLDNGMSVSQFCKAKGYTENMYYHWITQIHKLDPDFDTRGKSSYQDSLWALTVKYKSPATSLNRLQRILLSLSSNVI